MTLSLRRAFGALVGIGLCVAACGSSSENTASSPSSAEADGRGAPALVDDDVKVDESGNPHVGVVVAREDVAVSFQSSAEVAHVLVAVGQWVEQGDPLAELDTVGLDADIRQAVAALDEANAARRAAKDTLGDARRERKRVRRLARQGVVPAREVEQARYAVSQARSSLQQAIALVEQRESALEKLKFLRDQGQLRAPISGHVSLLAIDEGERVAAGATFARILSSGRDVRFAVPPSVASRIRAGDTVLVGERSAEQVARVSSVSPRVDQASQLIFGEATLDEQSELPPVGSRVDVWVKAMPRK